MTKDLDDMPEDEQRQIRDMLNKPLPRDEVLARRDALQSAMRSELAASVQTAMIRSALNGATEWLRFIDNENGRELSEIELRGVRSKLVECEAALRK